MTTAKRSGSTVGLFMLLGAGALGLLSISCCVFGVLWLRSTLGAPTGEAGRWTGRPIGECYDETYSRLSACHGASDFACHMRGQRLFTECTQVCTYEEGFCERALEGHCGGRCAGLTGREASRCQFVCGQITVVVRQYCAPLE